MKRIAAILSCAGALAFSQDTNIPAINMVFPVLTVARAKAVPVSESGTHVNRMADLEAHVIPRLTRHHSGPENYLFAQIQKIRKTAESDPAKAEQMTQDVIDQFKAWGVDL